MSTAVKYILIITIVAVVAYMGYVYYKKTKKQAPLGGEKPFEPKGEIAKPSPTIANTINQATSGGISSSTGAQSEGGQSFIVTHPVTGQATVSDLTNGLDADTSLAGGEFLGGIPPQAPLTVVYNQALGPVVQHPVTGQPVVSDLTNGLDADTVQTIN